MPRTHDKNKTKEQLIKELTELRQRIAELKRAENKRKKEVPRGLTGEPQEIIDSVKDGIVLLDLTGKVTAINKSITEVAGYAEEDIVGKRLALLNMFPPKSLASMLTAFTHVITGQQPPPYEVEVYTQTGEKLFIEIHGSLLKRGGKKAGVIAALREITDRKQLEALLLREKETFVTILQHALYGALLLDRDGRHVYVNPEFTAITGYTVEDIPTMRDWMHKAYPDESYRKKVAKLWEKDIASGKTRREISTVCKNGETKEIEFRSTLLEDGRAVVMLADITERKRAEEALQRHRNELEKLVTERTGALQEANKQLQREITERKEIEETLQRAYDELKESEERYRTLVSNIDLGINLIDADYTIVMANAAKTRHFKRVIRDLIGKKCFRVFEERDAVCLHCPGERAMATGQPAETESKVVGDDGRHYDVRIRAFPVFGNDGTVTKFIEIVEEITQRKRMEQKLRESEERFKMLAEHAPSGISIMAPDRSFEYLNPRFTKIFGYTMEDIPDKDTWFAKAYSDKTYRNKVISTWEKDIAEEVEIGEENPRVFTVRCKNGQDKIVDFRRVDLKDGKQYQIYEDITIRATAEEALRESEKELQTLMDASPIAISWGDLQGNIQYINRKHQKLFGYTLEEIPTITEWRRRADQDPAQRERFAHWEEELMEAHTHGKPLPPWEMTVTCKDGSVRHVTVEGTIVSNHRLVIYHDITERKQMEDELRKSEEWFRLLIENSADSFVLHDFEGRIIDVNQHACDSLGYTREELLGLSIQDIDQNFIKGKHKEKWNTMILGEPITMEGVHRRKDGTTFPVEIRLGVFESGGRRLMLGMVRDITERVRAEETIRKLAYHDALTGLPNRALFVDRLNRAMAQAHRNRSKFAVMLLDLDYFKNINDTLGHSGGDQLLSSVGKRLTELLRQEDTVSRMGGDEFCLLLSAVDWVQDTATIAQKVLKAFHEPFMLDAHEVHITTSIGVAMYPDDGTDVKTLLKNADIALYQAKQKGRNNYQHFTSAMDPGFQGDG